MSRSKGAAASEGPSEYRRAIDKAGIPERAARKAAAPIGFVLDSRKSR
jgi:hypothetical protein